MSADRELNTNHQHGPLAQERTMAVAPEGGWGYLVLLGVVFGFVATFGYMSCLGLMFADFLADLGLHTKALTLLPSCFYIFFSPVGLFANYLFQRFSVRAVGIVGAMVFCSGSMMIIFVRSLNELLIAYSLMQGIGFGLVLPALYTTFNRYFVKRRVMMMGLVGTLHGVCGVGLPMLIELLMQEYGFRGCMAVLAALNLHVLFGMVAMHPVEWHQPRRRDASDLQVVVELDDLLDQPNETCLEQKSFWTVVVDFLDLTLLYKPVYANICLGMALTLFSDVTFYTIQPGYLRELLFSNLDTALIVSIGAGADLVSRVFVTVTSSCVRFQARQLFLAGVVGTIGSQLAFQCVTGFAGVSAVTAMIGFFRAWLHIPIGIVFADYLPPSRFPSGYGLFMFVQGLVMFVVGPLVGWVRDATHSYAITFYILTTALAVCAVPWCIEMLVLKMRAVGKNVAISDDIEGNK